MLSFNTKRPLSSTYLLTSLKYTNIWGLYLLSPLMGMMLGAKFAAYLFNDAFGTATQTVLQPAATTAMDALLLNVVMAALGIIFTAAFLILVSLYRQTQQLPND